MTFLNQDKGKALHEALEKMAACLEPDIADDYENSELFGEVELLKEIYINELTLIQKDGCDRPECLSLLLHPATGDNVEEQMVCLTLDLMPPLDYPESPPDVIVRNSRGLADEHINSLRNELNDIADDRRGGPMLYELIELAKDSLTLGNIPYGSCVICLEKFEEGDSFMKTDCYHYFHSNCLLRYIEHSLLEIKEYQKQLVRHIEKEEKKVVCPVCRVPITYNVDSLKSTSTTGANDAKFKPNAELIKLQQEMSKLYLKQKAKGGIIDVEAESKKFLVSLRTPSPDRNASQSPRLPPPASSAAEVAEPEASSQRTASGSGRGRGRHGRDRHEKPGYRKPDRRDRRRDNPIPKPRGGFRPRREERNSASQKPVNGTSNTNYDDVDPKYSRVNDKPNLVNPTLDTSQGVTRPKPDKVKERDDTRSERQSTQTNPESRDRIFPRSTQRPVDVSDRITDYERFPREYDNTDVDPRDTDSPRDVRSGQQSYRGGRGRGRGGGRGRGTRGRRPPPGFSENKDTTRDCHSRPPPGFQNQDKPSRQQTSEPNS